MGSRKNVEVPPAAEGGIIERGSPASRSRGPDKPGPDDRGESMRG
jgi:hypothetical protein